MRNENIKLMLTKGETPMLAFEKQELLTELLGHTATQDELTKMLGEAMSTTSETWHDNAQADAITMQSAILEKQASGAIDALKSSRLIEKVAGPTDTVTIGTIVSLFLSGEQMKVLVLGYSRKLPAEITDENIMPINVSGPLGAAIFDKRIGDKTSYEVNGRVFNVVIESVETI